MFDPAQPRGQEEPHDVVVAVTAADICQEGLSVAVGEVARIASELVEIRKAIPVRGIAHPHGSQRVDAPLREVFSHPFNHPEGHLLEIEAAAGGAPGDAVGDVELKDMDKLVAENVVILRVVTGERQDDPVLIGVGEAAGAFSQELRGGGGLLEVGRVRVEHDRLVLEGMTEDTRETRVPPFGLPPDVVDHVGFLLVVVDVEVRCVQDLEVEVLPLHLVPAEVLRIRRRDRRERKRGHDETNEQLTQLSHVVPFVESRQNEIGRVVAGAALVQVRCL